MMPLTPEERAIKEKQLAELEAKEVASKLRQREMKEKELAELERKEKLLALSGVFDTLSTLGEEVVRPFKRVPEIYKEEVSTGLEKISQPGILNKLGGALQYGFSPLTALTQSFVKEPVQRTTETSASLLGAKPETAKTIGEVTGTTADIAANLFFPGYVSKAIKAGKPASLIAKEGRLKGAVPEGIPTEGGAPAPVTEIKDTVKKVAGELKIQGNEGVAFTPRLSLEVTDDIAKGAETALQGNLDESTRIFKQISEKLRVGEINAESVPEILQKYNLSPADFAKEYEATISAYGKGLGQLGLLAKKLKFAFEGNAQAMDEFERIAQTNLPSTLDKVAEVWNKAENVRRGLLVTQLATSARNAITQTGRFTLAMIDEPLQGVFKSISGRSMLDEVKNGFSGFSALYGRMSSSGRNRLNLILETENAVIEKARLLSQPVHEVTLGGKVTNVLNTVNRTQEYFFRKLAFEAKLRQMLGSKGLDFDSIDPKLISQGMMEKATDYALEMTFSASAKSDFGKGVVDAFRKIPLLYTVNPFPRFAFANALPFILDHSPLGYFKALSPSTLKALGSGNSELFAKHASRATIGTVMFMSAWQMRQSEYAGEKWYELNVNGKTVDARAFAPFSTYLFLAEAFTNPKNLKTTDFVEATIGLNRIAGTGLVFTDLLRAQSGESAKQILENFVGQYAGSFSVPFRTAKDIYSGIEPEEAIMRDTRQNPLIAPFAQNIPYISRLLPEKISPLKTARVKAETPVLRQLTGISLKTKTMVEKEVDKINLEYRRVFPRTGDPEADNKIAEYMGPLIEKAAPRLMASKNYRALTDAGKRLAMAELFKEARAEARRKLMVKNPSLSLRISVEGMAEDLKTVIEEKKGGDFLQNLIKGGAKIKMPEAKESMKPRLSENLRGDEVIQ